MCWKNRIICMLLCCSGFLRAQSQQPWIRVEGKNLVTENGAPFAMRGTNFGSWLMLEGWIPNLAAEDPEHLIRIARDTNIEKEMRAVIKEIGEFDDDATTMSDYEQKLRAALANRLSEEQNNRFWQKWRAEPTLRDAHSFWAFLERRFGSDGARRLYHTFLANWITETDVRLAKEIGFNFIRLPIWYRILEQDDNPYIYLDSGWQILDSFLSLCRNHSLYVVLDLHGAPGCQNPWDHSGQVDRNQLWYLSEYQNRTARLWRAIAQRYRDEPLVLGYDLLNEPAGAPTVDALTQLYDLVYRNIREVDKRHLIIMEDGFEYEGKMPLPADVGWKQIVYSNHFYETATDLAGHERHAERIAKNAIAWANRYGVPIYFGEFSMMVDSPIAMPALDIYLGKLNRAGMHWSPWTWKRIDDPQEPTTWSVLDYATPWQRPDMYHDSFESLQRTLESLHSKYFTPDARFVAVLKKRLADPMQRVPEAKN